MGNRRKRQGGLPLEHRLWIPFNWGTFWLTHKKPKSLPPTRHVSHIPKLRLRNWKILQRSLDPLSAGFKGVRWRRRGKDRVDIGRGKEGKVGKGKEGVGRQEWRGEEGVKCAVLLAPVL